MREYEEYERGEEFKAMGNHATECLRAILAAHDADSLARLARSAYKYTDCGASIGVMVYAGEDNPGRWVYGENLRDIKPDDFVCALSVSSIVEGCDSGTSTHIVDLFNEAFETPEHAAQAYAAALDAIDEEARGIWDDTHGCPTCAKHFGEGEGDDGMTRVWDECPDCKGEGSVI
jgi:hypothetical protein